MTRKLGRLLVVALVVAAVVAPMSVASADVVAVPGCLGPDGPIVYDATNPMHMLWPGPIYQIQSFVDQWALWNHRHHGGVAPTVPGAYIVFYMNDYFDGAPPAGEHFVFFWDGVTDPGLRVRIVGTQYADIICGSPNEDVIKGLGGDDWITGGPVMGVAIGGDDDIITGGPGNDVLIGGYGDDAIEGRGGDDFIVGHLPVPGTGGLVPTPFGPLAGNELSGGPGADTLVAGPTNDLLVGGPASDLLVGGSGFDVLNGQGGDDILKGGAANDTMWGGLGNDTMWGQTGNDTLYGDYPGALAGGDDTLVGSEPSNTDPAVIDWDVSTQIDLLLGGFGNDTLFGDAANFGVLDGAEGNDVVHAGAGDDTDLNVIPGSGNDTIEGGLGNDYLRGGLGDDTIYGGLIGTVVADDGADLIMGEQGADTLFGGNNTDRLYGDGIAAYAGGGEGNDIISGGDGDDMLIGGKGADIMNADAGFDWMFGGYEIAFPLPSPDAAVDDMYGGLGNDVFVGACADLDKATEAVAGGTDTSVKIPLLFGEFEAIILCP